MTLNCVCRLRVRLKQKKMMTHTLDEMLVQKYNNNNTPQDSNKTKKINMRIMLLLAAALYN